MGQQHVGIGNLVGTILGINRTSHGAFPRERRKEQDLLPGAANGSVEFYELTRLRMLNFDREVPTDARNEIERERALLVRLDNGDVKVLVLAQPGLNGHSHTQAERSADVTGEHRDPGNEGTPVN